MDPIWAKLPENCLFAPSFKLERILTIAQGHLILTTIPPGLLAGETWAQYGKMARKLAFIPLQRERNVSFQVQKAEHWHPSITPNIIVTKMF